MSKICNIRREIYIPSPQKHAATSGRYTYIGRGLRIEERRETITTGDWSEEPRKRYSEDNGRTWSDWELIYKNAPEQKGFVQSGGPSQNGSGPYDPVSGKLIKPVFQRLFKGDPLEALEEMWGGERRFCDHGFYQLSSDNGKTWDEGHLLKYEDGPDFDPEEWGNPDYFRSNEMYIGEVVVHSNGTVVISTVIPVEYRDEEDEKTPVFFPNTYKEGCVAGALCFVGRWDEEAGDYRWQVSNRIFLPRHISTRGLDELNLSELKNGNLLLVIRGSNHGLNPQECPGRKWMSVSKDGGLTWEDITDLRFDTGGQFYSPGAMARTIRSSRTGKLYCFLNISDLPVDGNNPRYPLYVAEIDEENLCLKKDTLTIVDDRDPEKDSEHLQLSNFGLFEDRETQRVELAMTRLGAEGPGDDLWTADTYKYIIDFL